LDVANVIWMFGTTYVLKAQPSILIR